MLVPSVPRTQFPHVFSELVLSHPSGFLSKVSLSDLPAQSSPTRSPVPSPCFALPLSDNHYLKIIFHIFSLVLVCLPLDHEFCKSGNGLSV